MDFIKIAICDDEKNIRAYLSSLVRKQGAECEIAEYASADEYLLDQTEYDLLFLDIELDGAASGMDGMELARRIGEKEVFCGAAAAPGHKRTDGREHGCV